MEHLCKPHQAQFPARCKYVPNTFGSTTPQHGFFDFDRQLGFKFVRLLRGNYDNELRGEHLEGIFQAWLYFCLLQDIFGPSLDKKEFIYHDEDTGDDWLSTLYIGKYIAEWKGRYDGATEAQRGEISRKTTSLLQAATYVLNRMLSAMSADWEPVRLISDDFELIGRVLIQTLEFNLVPDLLPRQRVVDESGAEICPRLKRTLLENQWCPNQVNMLSHILDVPSLYYATLLGPDASGKDHSACSDRLCKANQIHDATYQTAHVDSACRCAFAGPNPEDLADIVQGQHLPVISVVSNFNGGVPEVSVQKLTDGMRYIAISHVWADGLGNPAANTLPICQMLRLTHYVKQALSGGVMFWCDTLCVPTGPPELRRKAIWKMRDIYEKAYGVLVIDASLSTVSRDVSAEEISMRVTCSGWMRRLWTFQENVLAKKLYAVFGDGIVNIDRMVSTLFTREPGKPITASSYHSSIGLESSAFYRTFIPGQKATDTVRKGVDIGSVWESVQWRMTSWLADEPICLATALGIDLPLILNTPEDERMKVLYSHITGWPPYMIFATFERLSEPGWKWAPRTLMFANSMAGPKMYHMTDTTAWHRKGLIVEFPGFVAEPDDCRGDEEPLIDLRRAFSLRDAASGTWYSCFRDDQIVSSFDPAYLRISGLKQPAVVMSCPIEALSPTQDAAPQLWDGLLVDVSGCEKDLLYCDYTVRLLIGLCPPRDAAELEEQYESHTKESGRSIVLRDDENLVFAISAVEKAPQKWCIG